MDLLSVEYCHVTPENTWDEQIARANEFAALFLAGFGERPTQKCIMVDDVHSDQEVTPALIDKIVSRLKVKPDCIYLESAFVAHAQTVLDRLDRRRVAVIESAERTWLRNLKDRYDANSEFAVRWLTKDEVTFACPTLAATSYLVRLGNLPSVPTIWGEPVRPASLAVQLLSSRYLPVEAQVQLIIRAYDEALLKKLAWSFI
jgi:hypothetical protein